MMNLLQTTMQGFTRSASRRMDAELCILELCQPELSMDAKAINARITRIEEQLKTGAFVVAAPQKAAQKEEIEDDYDDRPPMPGDEDAPPVEQEAPPMVNEAPMGFWQELVAAARKELKPPASGFLTANPNAPVQGALRGGSLELRCVDTFTATQLNKPNVLEIIARKASSMLGRPVQAVVVDLSAKPAGNPRMEQLMNFGKAHPDVVKIRNN
jgi:DNA polymerase-3 subunit gamma/tau